MQPQISRQHDSIIIVIARESKVEKTGRQVRTPRNWIITRSALSQLISIVHCPNNPHFFLVSDQSRSISFPSFFPSLFFSIAKHFLWEQLLDSPPVIDNVFVIPQRAAGQREIRSAGKNDDRRKYPAPFPRGKSRREGEGATEEAWLVEN